MQLFMLLHHFNPPVHGIAMLLLHNSDLTMSRFELCLQLTFECFQLAPLKWEPHEEVLNMHLMATNMIVLKYGLLSYMGKSASSPAYDPCKTVLCSSVELVFPSIIL